MSKFFWKIVSFLSVFLLIVLNFAEGPRLINLFWYWKVEGRHLVFSGVLLLGISLVSKALRDTWNFFSKRLFEPNLNKIYSTRLGFALIVFNFPVMAYAEERLFREGTASYEEALWRSVFFAVAHCLFVGHDFTSLVTHWIAGMAFTWCYFQSGVQDAAVYHFVYNHLATAWILIEHRYSTQQEE